MEDVQSSVARPLESTRDLCDSCRGIALALSSRTELHFPSPRRKPWKGPASSRSRRLCEMIQNHILSRSSDRHEDWSYRNIEPSFEQWQQAERIRMIVKVSNEGASLHHGAGTGIRLGIWADESKRIALTVGLYLGMMKLMPEFR